jgi:hypothetical protein
MQDPDIAHKIRELVDEEHTLRSGDTAPDPDRLRQVEENLDQCWDLLRQRRAKQEFGDNPDEASVRSADTVEHYRQ